MGRDGEGACCYNPRSYERPDPRFFDPRADAEHRQQGRPLGLAGQQALERQDRFPPGALRRRHGPGRRRPQGCVRRELGRDREGHPGIGDPRDRHGQGGQALADRRRDPDGGLRDPPSDPGLSDHSEGARHRVPHGAPPSLAALQPAAGRPAGAQRGRAGHPRLLLRARLHPDRLADPHSGGLRGGRRPSSRPTTSATRRISASRASSISSRRPRPSARSTASAPPSGPRSRRPAAT